MRAKMDPVGEVHHRRQAGGRRCEIAQQRGTRKDSPRGSSGHVGDPVSGPDSSRIENHAVLCAGDRQGRAETSPGRSQWRKHLELESRRADGQSSLDGLFRHDSVRRDGTSGSRCDGIEGSLRAETRMDAGKPGRGAETGTIRRAIDFHGGARATWAKAGDHEGSH